MVFNLLLLIPNSSQQNLKNSSDENFLTKLLNFGPSISLIKFIFVLVNATLPPWIENLLSSAKILFASSINRVQNSLDYYY